jgi:glycyl-tRNA synthetase
MLEINATCLTPENVFVASGHVEKFCDYMVKDAKNN